MSWTATERFEARLAPDGLALVQELVNTHAVERGAQDLLADLAGAQQWLHGAARQWSSSRGLDVPRIALSHADVQALRDLRAAVGELLHLAAADPPRPPRAGVRSSARARGLVSLVTDDRGQVGLAPVGTGYRWFESALWSEVLLAQHSGTWPRLKLCREPGCRSAFYDTSRNSSGVWHNVRACGNIANQQAARGRRKARTTAKDADGSAGGHCTPTA